jgi:alanyl-tRNA synthetase
MARMRSDEIRNRFVEFFASREHIRLPSGSLVPPDWDTSVLLTTAGMQPLKRYFLGADAPPGPRATTVQKCFRASDIDEIGRTARHLTFFEMMGNFSFGDYFKDYAVQCAWELSTSPDGFGLDPSRIWATVYQGDDAVPPDEEAVRLWLEIGVPAERIVRLGSDNFWQAGPVGPCGPCSELYLDRGPERGCGRPECAPGCECDRFLEFWNLVFMQYNMLEGGALEPLPAPSVDTGSGVERVAAAVNDVYSVFETDILLPIIEQVEGLSGVGRRTGDAEQQRSLCILADHARGMTFMTGDGIRPSNEGRGYVLRRVIRRAVLHGRRLGIDGPVAERLHELVVDLMGDAYPELRDHQGDVAGVLRAEEERFSHTLETGHALLDDVLHRSEVQVSAEDAFRLHDTYGFPFELTAEIAADHGKTVDEAGFARLMDEQRERARASTAQVGFVVSELDAGFRTEFVGYEQLDVHTQIGALEAGSEDGVVTLKLRESPFYPAGGGQVSDQGTLEKESGERAELVEALRLEGDQELVFRGEGFAAGDRVKATVPWSVRFPTQANHTGTHLLHECLREVLGDHVRQAGSAVRPDKLRFDFTHPQALTADERAEVERRVNERVFQNLPVRIYETPIAEARKLGAMMLFGEKYGEIVRVVDIGGWSVELCGGTHVRSTAEIGPFAILSEGSVGSGARRIEAVTAGEAFAYLREQAREADTLRAELEQVRKESRKPVAEESVDVVAMSKEGNVLLVEAKGVKGGPLRDLSDRLRQQEKADGAIVASVDDGRAFLVVNFDESLVARGLDASQLVRELGKHIGGGGGGKPTLAEAGGKNPAGVQDALEAARKAVAA